MFLLIVHVDVVNVSDGNITELPFRAILCMSLNFDDKCPWASEFQCQNRVTKSYHRMLMKCMINFCVYTQKFIAQYMRSHTAY